MQTKTRLSPEHSHDFAIHPDGAEKRTRTVLLLTAVTMVLEIAAGAAFGSMALLADGWHMATHVGAFAITIFAYRYARRHADNPRFTYGTGKVSVLGGFASATVLAVVAFVMALESLSRLLAPRAIRFDEAIAIALLGLVVNLVSGWLLMGHHHHDHDGDDDHDHHHDHHHDHNLRAAYFHVLADALTSVLAIGALLAGKFAGWSWLDPVMGLVGAAVITRWAYGLMRDTSGILLDGGVDEETSRTVRAAIERDPDTRVADLHVWHVGPHHLAATVTVITPHPRTPEDYKERLAGVPHLCHVVVEVNVARD